MSGLDTLIAKPFENALKDMLDEKLLIKLQDRIFEKFGITVDKAVEDFRKLDFVLKELFGPRTDIIEKQVISKIAVLEDDRPDERGWITIGDPALALVVLESVGDNDKKNILNSVLDKPRIISDILDMVEISQTSGYRKINALIQNGMLIPDGHACMEDGKRVTRYRSVFENITIIIEKNKLTIKVLPTEEAMAKSTVMQSVGHWFRCGAISCLG